MNIFLWKKSRKDYVNWTLLDVLQHSLYRGSHGSSTSDVRTDKDHHKENKEGREPMGRPRAGSESSRNPVSKVMDLIRHRSHSTLSAEDKRKAVSNLILYHLYFPMLNRSKNIRLPQICNDDHCVYSYRHSV